MANLNEPRYHDNRDTPDFTVRRARVGRQLGARRLGASLYAFERLPDGGGLYELFRLSDAVDYMEGETPPG